MTVIIPGLVKGGFVVRVPSLTEPVTVVLPVCVDDLDAVVEVDRPGG